MKKYPTRKKYTQDENQIKTVVKDIKKLMSKHNLSLNMLRRCIQEYIQKNYSIRHWNI